MWKKYLKNMLSFSGTPVPSGQPCNYPEGSFAPVPDQQTGLCLCKVYRVTKVKPDFSKWLVHFYSLTLGKNSKWILQWDNMNNCQTIKVY